MFEKGPAPEISRGEPLLKWTGGKRWLAPTLADMLRAATFSRYFEPFCGGAAVFFHLAPHRAVLSDTNTELINCYRQVKQHPEEVITTLRRWENSSHQYYAVRESQPRSPIKRAARVIYLTSLSFNGIFRVNQRGKFNVPYGQRTHLKPGDRQKIVAVSKRLKTARLLVADFEAAAAEAKHNDLIYFDPPYTVAHGNNGFVNTTRRSCSGTTKFGLRTLRHPQLQRAAKLSCPMLIILPCMTYMKASM